ncbi:LPS export ABC transporter permease LptG [Sphingomonas sp. NSE70-1]|uniref:LPS export ABC transporter permease LptG n=1 Tax=Sphingomonas caseinilyticus TaxID=2908205 RepID=A0ABT0RTP7_9SPHN|nr:LPS export ABC transporter permease LptG [Sphingomonas caseinilyticus]MCL6698397.1 LPS export ABC transporter permease LptG [Sphingomonas caseinilyticus]
MINLDFMPSRQLAIYAARLFLTRSLAVLIMLVMVLMMLDLLGESGKILKVDGNGEAELWRYVSLRVPMLISRFLPFSVLLGALIAFVGLNQNSEVVAMKASGLSAHQILAPMVVASFGVAVLLFAFNELVVVKSARTVAAWTDADYEPIPPDSGILSNVWIRDGNDLVHAKLVGGRGPTTKLRGVTMYDREGGAITRVVEAERAEQVAGGWQLDNVRTYDARMNVVMRAPSMTALAGVEPSRFTLARVDPNVRDFMALGDAIDDLAAAGRPTEEARTGWWHKISGPLSTMLMPLLAATAAFGLARSGKVLLRATIGMALGFAYFVADNFSLALGNYGAYPPFLAAWAPFFLFLLIGEFVLIRQEE